MPQGLRFECQPGCIECCRQEGFVYLSEADLSRAAGFLGMSDEDFERKYVYRTRNLRRLRVPRAVRCPFLKGDGCSIHPAKPTQCRAFPFWPELVKRGRAWRKTAKYCPGIDKGPLIQIEAARQIAHEMAEAHPTLYPKG
ncbi:MAG TPA: YkgJ family cysteine cluster protein [Bryobacteraceae bacterium]|nr:YkgJ family cysteine cluster protein [Bryobacteraceae bacterium]